MDTATEERIRQEADKVVGLTPEDAQDIVTKDMRARLVKALGIFNEAIAECRVVPRLGQGDGNRTTFMWSPLLPGVKVRPTDLFAVPVDDETTEDAAE